LELSLEFQVGDAHRLTFKESFFDTCRAERVLLYLEDPAKAIAEMARVTRPGGHVIVFDFDYNAFFIDSDFAPMTRHIETLLACDPRNPLIGRELPHLMRRAHLKVDAVEQTTLAPNVAVARRIYAAALSKGIEAGLFTAADVEGGGSKRQCSKAEPSIMRIPVTSLRQPTRSSCRFKRFTVEARWNALGGFLAIFIGRENLGFPPESPVGAEYPQLEELGHTLG
jgi:SAM-dependent methyltransferase